MSKIITKIEAQKKKENRVNIFIDGEFSFGCSTELIYYHNLSKGREINVEELQGVIDEDNYLTAKTKALKHIESSLKTEFQVREKLELKEYDEKTIDRVITFLKDYKFIDDEYYAKSFVAQNIRIQGKGNIKYKLIKRGICEEIILKTLEEVPMDTEENVAMKLAEKKAVLLCKNEVDERKIKMKLKTFLVSKGYDFDTVKSVVEKIELNLQKDEDRPEDDNIKKTLENEEIYYSSEISLRNKGNSFGNSGKNVKSDVKEIMEENKEVDMKELIEIAQKRYERLSKSESDKMKIKRKLQDFLIRKGYTYSDIKSVISIVIHGEEYDY
ncbi:MAG: recombination regulator RecX [Clostridium sp.]|uniref:recombination regulator RecX n=1 Tax=Clostridium sp. TaxID=1506 RepID=UPI0032169263